MERELSSWCVNFGYPQKACGCAPAVVTKYQKRISDPLLDRVDIHIEVSRVDYDTLNEARAEESSALIQMCVQAMRDNR